jgi:predicted Fe-Mo cluster-binding NifX family protein
MKKKRIVAIVTGNGTTVSRHIAVDRKIALYEIPEGVLIETADNPVLERIRKEGIELGKKSEGPRHLGTGRIIPDFLAKKGADIFVAATMGEGMRQNLLELGIRPVEATGNIEEIIEKLKKGEIS